MQAHNKRGKKAKWNNVGRGLRANKKSFYKYIQEKEQKQRGKAYKEIMELLLATDNAAGDTEIEAVIRKYQDIQ